MKNKADFKKKVFNKLKKKKNRQNEKVYFGLDGGVIFLTKMTQSQKILKKCCDQITKLSEQSPAYACETTTSG